MSSKFNCFGFLIDPVIETKETKFQKYLKERNAKLLEKCFNLRKEEPIIENRKKVHEIKKEEETPSKQKSNETLYQQSSNSIAITANSEEIDLQQTTSRTIVPVKQSKTKTTKNNLPTSTNTNKNRFNSGRLINLRTLNTKKPTRLDSSTKWKSPFTSLTTNGTRSRLQRNMESLEFSYDLSRDELKFANRFCFPMKPASSAERQLLNSGQRKEYLLQRYEHSPVDKYNYPEATSWRIGWLHHKK